MALKKHFFVIYFIINLVWGVSLKCLWKLYKQREKALFNTDVEGSIIMYRLVSFDTGNEFDSSTQYRINNASLVEDSCLPGCKILKSFTFYVANIFSYMHC